MVPERSLHKYSYIIKVRSQSILEVVCLLGSPETSLKESRRTVKVPERSLGYFWHSEWIIHSQIQLYINFQVYNYPESRPSLRFSRDVTQGV